MYVECQSKCPSVRHLSIGRTNSLTKMLAFYVSRSRKKNNINKVSNSWKRKLERMEDTGRGGNRARGFKRFRSAPGGRKNKSFNDVYCSDAPRPLRCSGFVPRLHHMSSELNNWSSREPRWRSNFLSQFTVFKSSYISFNSDFKTKYYTGDENLNNLRASWTVKSCQFNFQQSKTSSQMVNRHPWPKGGKDGWNLSNISS